MQKSEFEGGREKKSAVQQSVPTQGNNTTLVDVPPRTLFSKEGQYYDIRADEARTVTYVMGGKDGDVFCAMFADSDEAAAWVLASNNFGQPIKGFVYGEAQQVRSEAGSSGGDVPQNGSGVSGRSG